MITYSTNPTNLKYLDENSQNIEMTVLFDGFSSPVIFVANLNDVEPHGIELFSKALAGDFGPIAPYAPEPVQPVVQQPAPDIAAQIAAIEAQLAALKAQI